MELQQNPKQLLSSFEGTFIGNGDSNKALVIDEISSTVLFRTIPELKNSFFKRHKVENEKFVFDLSCANLVIFLIARSSNSEIEGYNVQSLSDVKISSCGLEEFNQRLKDSSFGSQNIIKVLHTPAKPFSIIGEESMYEIIGEVYIREVLTEKTTK